MPDLSPEYILFCLKWTHICYNHFSDKLHGVKVLHIDDSPEICDLYKDMFTADNHSVRSVSSGKKGLELAVKNDYDLILLDMNMPDYTGMQFLHDLQNKRSSELKKVVVVSVLKFMEIEVKEN